MTKPANPFRYFDSSPEIIRLVVMMYVRYPLSLRNVEDLLAERGIDICHETVRLWWNRFGPMPTPARAINCTAAAAKQADAAESNQATDGAPTLSAGKGS
jgi:transposase-like protein